MPGRRSAIHHAPRAFPPRSVRDAAGHIFTRPPLLHIAPAPHQQPLHCAPHHEPPLFCRHSRTSPHTIPINRPPPCRTNPYTPRRTNPYTPCRTNPYTPCRTNPYTTYRSTPFTTSPTPSAPRPPCGYHPPCARAHAMPGFIPPDEPQRPPHPDILGLRRLLFTR